MRTVLWSLVVALLASVLPLTAESINPPTKPQTAPMAARRREFHYLPCAFAYARLSCTTEYREIAYAQQQMPDRKSMV